MNTFPSRTLKTLLILLTLLLLSGNLSAQSGVRAFPGIDTLERSNFQALQGKRVGLLTNPAGVNHRGESTIDVLRRAPGVRLLKLFGPEHGIYGDEKANVPIQNRTDQRTGLPVYSLYGDYRKPTPDMLRGLDALVIDLQCVGSRSYTYISCMRLVIEACFEYGVEVVVLDRPNPLGGLKVDGPMMDEEWMSYVGAYPIPYVYGLTIGELARMAHGTPGWLKVEDEIRRRGRLTVIPMTGWRRSMTWGDTGLRWVPPSPAIPNPGSAIGYAMVGLGCQIGPFSHGYGTPFPFRVLSYRGKSPEEIKRALDARSIPGLSFHIMRPTPQNPNWPTGVFVRVDNFQVLRPTELNWHLMQITLQWESPNPFANASRLNYLMFNRHVGSTELWNHLIQGNFPLAQLRAKWDREARAYQEKSRRFWLYQP